MTYKKVQLIELLTPISKQIQPKDFGNMDYVGLEHLKSGVITIGDVGTASEVKSTKWEFQPEDILYGKLRPYLNKCAVADRNGICSTDILVLRANKNVDARYVAYCLSSNDFVEYANSTVSGMNLPRTTWSKFNDYELSVPVCANGELDLAEQKRVVETLQKTFSGIEKGRELLTQQSGQAINLKQSLLASVYSSDWERKKLVDVASVFDDGDWIESKDQSSQGVWLVQTGNIGVITFRDKERKRFVSEDTFKRLNCTEIFAGDILISRLPDPIGRACIVPKSSYRMITAVDCTILRLKQGYEPRYINYLLNARQTRQQVYGMITGSSRKRISRKNLGTVELPIPFKNGSPDFDTQKRIADELEGGFSMSEHLCNLFSTQEKSFIALRSSVLNQSYQMQT